MIPTRSELLDRWYDWPDCNREAWAEAEIRRALIAELEALLDGAPPTATNEWWYQAILNRVSAMIDKPEASRG